MTGLCECGCGRRTKVAPQTWRAVGWIKGQARRFVRGHNARVKPQASNLPAPVHGESAPRTPEYQTWLSMLARCYNRKFIGWKYYGARGIRVCRAWRDSYPTFLAHVGRKPTPAHSLDRYPNNDGNYRPGNVRWATPSEQARNRRRRPR
jgi:hypothetical protein